MTFREFSIAADRIAQTLGSEERIEWAARLLELCASADELGLVARWLGHGVHGRGSLPATSGAAAVRQIYSVLTRENIVDPGSLDHALFEASRRMAGGTLEAVRLLLQARGDVPTSASPDMPLDMGEVAASIASIAARKSTGDRLRQLTELWIRMSPVEIYWLHRSLSRSEGQRPLPLGELEEAIALATGAGLEQVRFAVMLRGDAGEVALDAACGALGDVQLRPMQPLGFMLAERASHVLELALTQISSPVADHALEPMLPGIRVQAHCWGAVTSSVALYTRASKNIAPRLPEIAVALASLPAGTVVDGQIVATSASGALLGHEELGELLKPRPRRAMAATPRFVAFDIMVAHGSLLLTEPLCVRRTMLEEVCGRAGMLMVRRTAAGDHGRVIRLARELVSSGADGIVLKRLDSAYAFGRRDTAWTKMRIESRTVRTVVRYATIDTSGEEPRIQEMTLGLWRESDGERQLVNICRTVPGHGLDDLWSRLVAAKLQRFGSTWELAPQILCEVRFDAVRANPRTAAGCTLVAAAIVKIHPQGASLDSVGSVEGLSRFGPAARTGGLAALVERPLPFEQ